MAIINFPILYVPDPTKGRPLFNGQIFVGVEDLDPEIPSNQKQLNVVQEDGTVVPVSQPFILSSGGVPVYNGSPVRLDVDGNYSIKILDRLGAQVYYIHNTYQGEPITPEDGGEWFVRKENVLQDAIDSTELTVGDIIYIKERVSGSGGAAFWDVVLASSVTPNGEGIVQCVGQPSLALVLIDSDINDEESITDTIQAMSGFIDIEPSYISELKALGDIANDTDSVTIKRKAIKAWKKPTGISDSAVAGSFVLGDGTSEPGTQVSNFVNVDNIGAQTSRDAVAVFGQVDSAPALLETSNVTYTASTITSPDFAAIWDELDEGLICDVNFGSVNWVGAVILSKSGGDTLSISSWRNIDGVSGPAATPANNTPLTIDRHNAIWGANFNAIATNDGGANQAIGIEVGLQCVKPGTGANSKGFFAVAFPGGERPEFGYSLTGLFGKGYTSQNCDIYGFQSTNEKVAFNAIDSTEEFFKGENTTTAEMFIVDANCNVKIGKNAEAGTARLNVRGDGQFSDAYDETEFAIYDPTVAVVDREGFSISQNFPASSSAGNIFLGTQTTPNHTYNLRIITSGLESMTFRSADNNIQAGVDNAQTFGTAGLRWSEIFAGNGTINTSDEREKEFLGDFSEAEKRVALKLKSLLTKYKWNKSVEREVGGGNKARIHVGIGAQSLGQAFTDEGLDPHDYAMFCYDEWEDEKDGTAKDRYGVRIEQVNSFILANI